LQDQQLLKPKSEPASQPLPEGSRAKDKHGKPWPTAREAALAAVNRYLNDIRKKNAAAKAAQDTGGLGMDDASSDSDISSMINPAAMQKELTGVGVGAEVLQAQPPLKPKDASSGLEMQKAQKELVNASQTDDFSKNKAVAEQMGLGGMVPEGNADPTSWMQSIPDAGKYMSAGIEGYQGTKDAALSLFSGNLPMKEPETMSDSVDQMRTAQANNQTAVASAVQDLSRSGTASASVGVDSQARQVQMQNNQNAVTVQDQGGAGMGLDPQTIASLTEALNKFNSDLASNIETLQNTTVKIQLEKTNIIVDIRGGAFFDKMKGELKQELLKEVGNQLNKNSLDAAGKPSQSESQLGK